MLAALLPPFPMKVLALETSSEFCSAALALDGRVIAREAQVGQGHSETLLPMAVGLMAEAGVTLRMLDGIAFGAGPGSFTGLRIACGVAQGLAFGVGVKVVGIPTLLALAQASGAARAICCIDARMGEVYHAAYERTGAGWRTVHEPGLYRPAEVPPVEGTGWTGVGTGFAAHGAALAQRYGAALSSVEPQRVPGAGAVAELAAAEFARGGGVAAEAAAPLYIRDKVALRVDER
jgi:tRNA threonylcarbamoyladenosine biosynthesis protein TsaB